MSTRALTSSVRTASSHTNDLDGVFCNCNKPAPRLQVKKENHNKGRWFYTCRDCKFFKWDDGKPAQKQNDNRHDESTPTTPAKSSPSSPNNGKGGIEQTLFVHSSDLFGCRGTYNPTIISLMEQIPAAKYETQYRAWLFPYTDYQKVVDKLESLKANYSVKLKTLPPVILEVMALKEKPIIPDEIILNEMRGRIPQQLFETLMPFQVQGVKEAIRRDGRVLIGDEMGLGKTIQAITISAFYRAEWPVLVICPSSLRLTWKAEIKRWLSVLSPNIQTIFESKEEINPTADFCIISYDMSAKFVDRLKNSFDIIICDESHYLKNKKAKRTKTITPLIKRFKRAILLSGTPSVSRPIELFTQLNALSKRFFPDYYNFGVRYCGGRQQGMCGLEFNRSSNLPELNWIMQNTVMIRRLKKDVLKDLPPKIRQCVYIGISEKDKKSLSTMLESSAELRDLGNIAGNEGKGQMSEMYRETGRAKLPGVIEYLTTLLESTSRKIIVFAHHREVLDGIALYLENSSIGNIRIDGETSQKKRQDLCDSFQTVEKVRVALLGITAAGVGLTLNKADVVVFAELFWNPAQLLQGEDRAHRIGRVGSVDIKYLLAEGTLDDIQWPLLTRKLKVVGKSLDGFGSSLMSSNESTASSTSTFNPTVVPNSVSKSKNTTYSSIVIYETLNTNVEKDVKKILKENAMLKNAMKSAQTKPSSAASRNSIPTSTSIAAPRNHSNRPNNDTIEDVLSRAIRSFSPGDDSFHQSDLSADHSHGQSSTLAVASTSSRATPISDTTLARQFNSQAARPSRQPSASSQIRNINLPPNQPSQTSSEPIMIDDSDDDFTLTSVFASSSQSNLSLLQSQSKQSEGSQSSYLEPILIDDSSDDDNIIVNYDVHPRTSQPESSNSILDHISTTTVSSIPSAAKTHSQLSTSTSTSYNSSTSSSPRTNSTQARSLSSSIQTHTQPNQTHHPQPVKRKVIILDFSDNDNDDDGSNDNQSRTVEPKKCSHTSGPSNSCNPQTSSTQPPKRQRLNDPDLGNKNRQKIVIDMTGLSSDDEM
ncbi:P-loop containing nucleoside triphosphate hydrolase protein [Paraphysoderma sedebokerense]|nr:P-loop containing nucleoside triphosphate hydrolase protein [Paraphysoderma sedebokerense]